MTVPMREICFLIGPDDSILWGDASDSPIALPDSRRRWEEIWLRRDAIEEVAHSHPGGPPGFSAEDASTMAAIDAALGRSLRYSVVSPAGMVRNARQDEGVAGGGEPWWADLMRVASGILR
jgi:hypothetical protein